jgi:hypothetical protein
MQLLQVCYDPPLPSLGRCVVVTSTYLEYCAILRLCCSHQHSLPRLQLLDMPVRSNVTQPI